MSRYDFFDNRKRNGLGHKVKVHQATRLLELASDLKPGARHLLELGPGDGYFAQSARRKRYEYTAIEGNSRVVQRLRERGYDVIHADLPPIPENIGPFDVCCMLHIVEHLNNPSEVLRLLEGTRQVLTPKGLTVIATPDYESWGAEFFNSDYTHQVPFTRRRLRQIVHDAGFSMIYEGRYSGPAFGSAVGPLSLMAHLFSALLPRSAATFHDELLYRGYLTFLPNLIAIGQLSD